MDLGRELGLINKHVRNKVAAVGESVIWYQFKSLASSGSVYDDIYDEGAPGSGGRSYAPGVIVPTIYASEDEDEFRSIPDGIKLTQTVRLTILLEDMVKAGIDRAEEYNSRINDMFKYDDRYYRVASYTVRGRMRGNEVLVAVSGIEVFMDEEMPFDNGPDTNFVQSLPWPTSFPS